MWPRIFNNLSFAHRRTDSPVLQVRALIPSVTTESKSHCIHPLPNIHTTHHLALSPPSAALILRSSPISLGPETTSTFSRPHRSKIFFPIVVGASTGAVAGLMPSFGSAKPTAIATTPQSLDGLPKRVFSLSRWTNLSSAKCSLCSASSSAIHLSSDATRTRTPENLLGTCRRRTSSRYTLEHCWKP